MTEPAAVAAPRCPRSLVRTELLARALDMLATLDELTRRAPRRSAHLVESVESCRERLAQRAASVGLAGVASAEELRVLDTTLSEVEAMHGWMTRELRLL